VTRRSPLCVLSRRWPRVMTRISTFCVILSPAIAAVTVPIVVYAGEINVPKISVSPIRVPNVAVPHANAPAITPHVNTGAGAHITIKVRVLPVSKRGSISEKSDKSSQGANKMLQDQLQQLQTNTSEKQDYKKLEGALEQEQGQLNNQISKERFSLPNKVDPAAKASVVFIGKQNSNNAERVNALRYENARWQDWQEQITSAQNELKQLGAQLDAANIRVSRAQQQSNNGRQQVENTTSQENVTQQKFNSYGSTGFNSSAQNAPASNDTSGSDKWGANGWATNGSGSNAWGSNGWGSNGWSSNGWQGGNITLKCQSC
jgi:hypothetical protein